MPALESNSSVSLHVTRPRSGVIRPAIILTIEVLPEPDGPNSAVTPSGASNLALTRNSPSCLSTSTVSISGPVQSRAGAAGQPLGGDQCDQRDDDRDDGEPGGGRVAARNLQISIDRRRDRLRLTRNVRDERDRR